MSAIIVKNAYLLGQTSGVSLPDKRPLNDMPWQDIRAVARAGKAAEYWKLGDRKAVMLSGDSVHNYNRLTYAFIVHMTTANLTLHVGYSALSGGHLEAFGSYQMAPEDGAEWDGWSSEYEYTYHSLTASVSPWAALPAELRAVSSSRIPQEYELWGGQHGQFQYYLNHESSSYDGQWTATFHDKYNTYWNDRYANVVRNGTAMVVYGYAAEERDVFEYAPIAPVITIY